MGQKLKFTRKTALLSLVPQLIVMGALGAVFSLVAAQLPDVLLLTASTYLLVSFLLKRGFNRYHVAGIALLKKNNFSEALNQFRKSYAFFEKHPWIDRYRYVTLLSSSRISYTEMALLNAAYCCIRLQKPDVAKEYYQQALALFPGSRLAGEALQKLDAFEKKMAVSPETT